MSSDFVNQCSYCERLVDDDGEPVCSVYSRDLPDGVTVTHGCCNECLVEQRAKLEQEKRGRAELELAAALLVGKYRLKAGTKVIAIHPDRAGE